MFRSHTVYIYRPIVSHCWLAFYSETQINACLTTTLSVILLSTLNIVLVPRHFRKLWVLVTVVVILLVVFVLSVVIVVAEAVAGTIVVGLKICGLKKRYISERNKTSRWTETRGPINFLTSMTGCSLDEQSRGVLSTFSHLWQAVRCDVWRRTEVIKTISGVAGRGVQGSGPPLSCPVGSVQNVKIRWEIYL